MLAYWDQLGVLSEYIGYVYFFFDATKKHVDIILPDNSNHFAWAQATQRSPLFRLPLSWGSTPSLCHS